MSTVSTTWPLALTISTFTLVAAEASSKPPLPVLSSMVTVEPSVNTLRPTRAVPCMTCSELNCAAMLAMVWFSCWMPVTVLICAICDVIWALSRGFIGSWLFSCATSSFRNRSCAAAGSVLGSEALVLPVVVPAVVWVGLMIMRISPGCRVLYWPICRVLRSSDLAVFMTSTLFWYEREAEIMLTISSTAFTLEWFT